ncbi:ribonuclease H-like domain-containing protein [Candidatus Parcubacteria bacterium]|nr:ribonuclease H-like domain-containing protein [Patescibacteria group bacterium]MBU4482385.1 ribonuclease H-like domain-containing protein [Patescibacteria group bacterium]MCG2686957.1 ribonuclease H-like domain-containing protein [Candidatus Parcubacteria bacterium]
MKLVLDIETQNSFKDIGGKSNLKALKISLVGAYWYEDNKFLTFMEDELDELGKLIKQAELVIGFNLIGFDYPVLENYLKNINFNSIKTLDIMAVLQKYLGYRVKLESVAQATLGTGKSGTGLKAISMWRKGQIEDLKKYCLKDVEVTKNIYEYGIKNKYIKFKSLWKSYDVPVEWY